MRLSNFLHWTGLILIVWFHFCSGLSIEWEDVEQTADFQPSSGFGDSPRTPICGTGLSSGCWHPCALTDVMPPVSNWANNKWKQGAGLQSACVTGARRGCRGSAAFSERSFSTRRPKSTFQLNLQPSECRLNESERKWREMERKWQKEYRGEVFFFPSEKLMFHRFGFPQLLEAHMPTVIHLGRHHPLPLINQMMVWWAENEGGD